MALSDEDRKAFWSSGSGVFAKFLFKSALVAFVLPIAATILLAIMKNPNINGIGIGLGLLISFLLLLAGVIVTLVGLLTFRKTDVP